MSAIDDITTELSDKIDSLTKAKDNAYSERNKLLALLAGAFVRDEKAWLSRHPESDSEWEDDWRWIVFIDTSRGQACWHIHDSELPMFQDLGLPVEPNNWDGHTTEEKYERLRKLALDWAWGGVSK